MTRWNFRCLVVILIFTCTPLPLKAEQIAPSPNPSGGTIDVTASDANNSEKFWNYGELNIKDGGVLINQNTLTARDGGKLLTESGGTLINLGTLNTSDGYFTNGGTLNNSGGLTTFVLKNTGTVNSSGWIGFFSINNSGTVNIESGGAVGGEDWSNQNTGIINNYGSWHTEPLTNYGTVNNHGSMDINWGLHNFSTFNNSNLLTASSGTSMQNELGGTFNNSGTIDISRFGNSGTFNYSSGNLNLVHGSYIGYFTNTGLFSISGSGDHIVNGDVINTGTVKTTHTTVYYNGTFTNNGAYISDPATQTFNNLIIGQNGYLVGQMADAFKISGNLISSSIMNNDWNTRQSCLQFITGTGNIHDFYLTGADYGANMPGYANNFAWGTLDVTENIVHFYDGNSDAGAALYLRDILGLDITDMMIANLFGFDGLDIYYMANLPDNRYLNGLTYALAGGGHLAPIPTPEPSTMLLLGSGLVGLIGYGRRRRFQK